jgi:hypothetical protein
MRIQWRKSSYSGMVNDSACVELGRLSDSVGLRDSKHPESGHLSLSREVFSRLLTELRCAEM